MCSGLSDGFRVGLDIDSARDYNEFIPARFVHLDTDTVACSNIKHPGADKKATALLM
jgi:hypothetical protein